MFITEANPDAIAKLWQRLRSMLTRVSVIVGALPALAILSGLTRRRQREIASSIALLEAIVRKLLLIAAAELRKVERANAKSSRLPHLEIVTLASPKLGVSPRPTPTRNPPPFDPSQPETWRVRFKLAPPRDPLACPESRAPRIRALWGDAPSPEPRRNTAHAAKPRPAAMRLALRFEALRRVLENPLPHARRLARIFHRFGCRYPEAAGRYAVASARPHASDPGDPRLIIECMMLAIAAAEIFANTS